MNTDGYKIRRKIREQNFNNNMLPTQVKYSNNKEYASNQHADYDKKTNQILYGIDTNLKAMGVSDGSCDQINSSLTTSKYKCGFGAAGGTLLSQSDAYNHKFENIEGYENENHYSKHNINNIIEEFETLHRRIKISEIVVAVLVLLFLLSYCN